MSMMVHNKQNEFKTFLKFCHALPIPKFSMATGYPMPCEVDELGKIEKH